MPPIKDLTGKTFNRLTVIERDNSRKGVYWLCKCSCGNTISVRAYNLTSGSTKSCGCLNNQNRHLKKRNYKDITGNRYGDLEVLRYVSSNRNGTQWECKCHNCGSITIKTAAWLKSSKSCGCKMIAASKHNFDKNHNLIAQSKSNLSILRDDANANNMTTGVRGVCYISSTQRYVAYISYKGKRYTLCRSTDINECIAARKAAEKAIRNDFIDWLEDFRAEKED